MLNFLALILDKHKGVLARNRRNFRLDELLTSQQKLSIHKEKQELSLRRQTAHSPFSILSNILNAIMQPIIPSLPKLDLTGYYRVTTP